MKDIEILEESVWSLLAMDHRRKGRPPLRSEIKRRIDLVRRVASNVTDEQCEELRNKFLVRYNRELE